MNAIFLPEPVLIRILGYHEKKGQMKEQDHRPKQAGSLTENAQHCQKRKEVIQYNS